MSGESERVALETFVRAIERAGGVEVESPGDGAIVSALGATALSDDLADAYLAACEVLGRSPKVRVTDHDQDDGSP